MFADRTDELKTLRKRLRSNRFELIIIYGRRRIGKTKLILEAVKRSKHIYFFATEADNIKHFKYTAARTIPETAYIAETWEALFNFLKGHIIIIDEFTNLIAEDPAVLSEFQRLIDTNLAGTRTKLILLGSAVSMMGDRVLSYKSPLYGRKTSSIKVKPLRFRDLREFFPKADPIDLAEIYGFSDGIPYYLEMIEYPFWKWLERNLSEPDCFIKYEIDFLMKYEFDDVSTYKRVLEAIANGNHTPAEIRNHMGVRHSDVTPYLRNLMEVELIKREVPILESERSRFGRYYFNDNFLKFWFKFIYPNMSALEARIFSIDEIKTDYDDHMGRVFEKIAHELIIDLGRAKQLPAGIDRLGRWWRKGEEIDAVALGKRNGKSHSMFFEVKWAKMGKKDIERTIAALKRKSELVDLKDHEKHYLIICKSSSREDERVYDLSRLEKIL